MQKRRTHWLLAVMSVLMMAVAMPAAADPIVINGGGVAVANGLDLPGFSLTGSDSSFNGILPVGGSLCCVFGAGDTVSLDRSYTLTSFPGQPTGQVVNGTVYPRVFVSGTLSFSTTPFTVPPPSGSSFSLSTPFVANGHISGFADLEHTIPLFSVDLSGTGTATVTGRTFGATDFGDVISFQFGPGSPSPTPEPVSALLLGTGMAVVALWRRGLHDRGGAAPAQSPIRGGMSSARWLGRNSMTRTSARPRT